MSSAFTPLERAALDGLVWELSATAPDLAGQIAESLPGQRRVHGAVLVTEAIVDRHRPSPPQTTTGRLGTIHVTVDHLDHPVAFQVELLNGRLIALHGDAYGQDLGAVTLTGDVVDQVFMVMADGRTVPFDRPVRDEDIRAASPLRRMQENPDPPDPFVAQPAHGVTRPKSSSSPELDALFGPRPSDASSSSLSHAALGVLFGKPAGARPPDLPAGEVTPDDLTSVRIGIVALTVLFSLALSFVLDFPVFFAAIPAFWVARGLLKKPVVEQIARAISARR